MFLGWKVAAPLAGDYILHEVQVAIDAPIKEVTTQAQDLQTAAGNRQDEVNVRTTTPTKCDGPEEGTDSIFSSEPNHFRPVAAAVTSRHRETPGPHVVTLLQMQQQQATKQETDVISKDQSEIQSLFLTINTRKKQNR